LNFVVQYLKIEYKIITFIDLIWKASTVKPVLRGHLWDKEKVALQDRWPFNRGSIHMKFSDSTWKRW
jgi:hypothetical protein